MKSKLALAALLLVFGGAAMADEVGQHPAVFAPRTLPGVDASTFLVGHPASPAWGRAGHANFDHPAVVQARLAASAGVDANTFLVQPPASVAWALASAPQPARGASQVAAEGAAAATTGRVAVVSN